MTTNADPRTLVDLDALAIEELDKARAAKSGRAATNLIPGSGALSQTVMALAQGRRLDDHSAPGPATLQVLHGNVTLTSGHTEVALGRRQWIVIPDEVHSVHADSDAAMLLTVALTHS